MPHTHQPTNHLPNLNLCNSEASPLTVTHQNQTVWLVQMLTVTESPSPCHPWPTSARAYFALFEAQAAAPFSGRDLGLALFPELGLRRRIRRVGGLVWSGVTTSLREEQRGQEES